MGLTGSDAQGLSSCSASGNSAPQALSSTWCPQYPSLAAPTPPTATHTAVAFQKSSQTEPGKPNLTRLQVRSLLTRWRCKVTHCDIGSACQSAFSSLQCSLTSLVQEQDLAPTQLASHAHQLRCKGPVKQRRGSWSYDTSNAVCN